MMPSTGEVLRITRDASVQFQFRPILFRVIRVDENTTVWGWVWLDGYELSEAGDATERRTIFVQLAGLHPAVMNRPQTPAGSFGAPAKQRNARGH